MDASSWLFIKGDQSIRVVCPSATVLIVKGPGASHSRYSFEDDAAVQAYQMELAEEFSSGGWVLIGEDFDRRSGQERRAARRDVPERRRTVAAGDM
jgi:hypothetical protein